MAFKQYSFLGLSGTLSLLHFHQAKPVLHSLFLLPFLFLTGGNILASAAVVSLIAFLVLVTYVYALLRVWLPVGGSAIGSLLIATLPWMYFEARGFSADLFFCAAAIGALYHLLSSDSFQNRRHAVASAVCVSFAICFRPVEGALFLAVPVAIFFWWRCKRAQISVFEFWALISSAIASVAIFVFLGSHTDEYDASFASSFYFLPLLVFWIFYLVKKQFISNVAYFALVVLAVIMLWLAPIAGQISGWLKMGVVGTGAFHSFSERVDYFLSFFSTLGGWTAILLVILAIPVLFRLGKGSERATWSREVLPITVVLIVFHVFLGSFLSQNAERHYRYYFPSAVVLFILLLVLALDCRSRFFKMRTCAVSALVVCQVSMAFGSINPRYRFGLFQSSHLFDRDRNVEQDSFVPFAEQIVSVINTGGFNVALAAAQTPGATDFYDPDKLELLARSMGADFTFSGISEKLSALEPRKELSALAEKSRYLLVGPMEVAGTSKADPFMPLIMLVRDKWRKHRLADLNVEFFATVKDRSESGGVPRTFLLVRFERDS